MFGIRYSTFHEPTMRLRVVFIINADSFRRLWIIIDLLKKGDSLNRLKIDQLVTGIVTPTVKKYEDSAVRLRVICNDYENRSIDDDLFRGILHNFQHIE